MEVRDSTRPRELRLSRGLQAGRRIAARAVGYRPAVEAAICAVLALLLTIPVLRLWRADLAVPMTGYHSDANLNTALVKDVIDHGWFQTDPSVAAPFGQHLYDFAIFSGDNLNFALIKVLSFFSHDPAVVINLYFLLTFPLIALTALYVLRQVGVRFEVALLVSLLYAFLPYHFIRGVNGHLFLSAYYAVPLGTWLVFCVLDGRQLFARSATRTGVLAFASWRTAGTVAICAVVASAGLYYSAFTLILLGVCGVAATIALRALRPLGRAALLAGVIGAVMLFNFAPNLAYRLSHGPNPAVGHRLPQESEIFSLKLIQLILPVPGHPIDRFAYARFKYDSTAPSPPDYGVAMGLLGTIGLAALAIVLLVALLRPVAGETERRLRHVALVGIVTLSFVTVGGLGSLFAYAITPQLRGWYRLSVFVAFVSMLAVGLLLSALLRRLPQGWLWRAGVLAVLALALVGGLLDQTNATMLPPYATAKAEYRSDAAFVRDIERRLPDDAAIYQLPYVPFPEAVIGAVDSYEESRLYLHSHDLRWSWGAMRGRTEDWQGSLQTQSPETQVEAVAAAGFDGVAIERVGYGDHGADLEARIRRLTGSGPLASSDGEWSFFDLRPLQRRLRAAKSQRQLEALRVATLHPFSYDYVDGFASPESGVNGAWRWMGPTGEIKVYNPSDVTSSVIFQSMVTAPSGPARLDVRGPLGGVRHLRVGPTAKPLWVRFAVPPGNSYIQLATTARRVPAPPGDERDLFVRFDSPGASDAAFVPFLKPLPPA